jgi:hypothetical protein
VVANQKKGKSEKKQKGVYPQQHLNGTGNVNFSDGLRIVNEMILRARNVIPKDRGFCFLNLFMVGKFEQANKVFRLRVGILWTFEAN